jgi:triosephosphate isomerase
MSKKIVIGNWKMHPARLKDAESLLKAVAKGLPNLKKTLVVVAVPAVYIEKLKKISKKVSVGAQDCFYDETGAFTGQVSPAMLADLGVKYAIIGHSERRHLGETNQLINKKLKEAIAERITPILCVGEKERGEGHEYFETVKAQLKECLAGISKNLISKIVIAYEPVWALSSTAGRRDATAADSLEMAIYIRKILSDITNPSVASSTRVIYGGSVNEKDAGDFLEHGGVDGVLPGKASLTPAKFIQIVNIAENL